jgi:LmbE family N-acetylglucosaminyl deacetylase
MHGRRRCSGAVSPPIAILSPHLDDAVLSCWDVLSGPDDVLVVNVFAGLPSPGAPPGWWDAICGLHDSHAAVGTRLAEDRAALALAGREPINLSFLDHQYRDGDLPVGAIASALRDVLPPHAVVLAPGALAHEPFHPTLPEPHPDHVAVRSAALELFDDGYPLALYADLPHANARGWPSWVLNGAASDHNPTTDDDPPATVWRAALAETGLPADRLVPDVHRLTARAFARKLDAVRRYASQLRTLDQGFGPLDNPELLGYEVTWRASPAR